MDFVKCYGNQSKIFTCIYNANMVQWTQVQFKANNTCASFKGSDCLFYFTLFYNNNGKKTYSIFLCGTCWHISLDFSILKSIYYKLLASLYYTSAWAMIDECINIILCHYMSFLIVRVLLIDLFCTRQLNTTGNNQRRSNFFCSFPSLQDARERASQYCNSFTTRRTSLLSHKNWNISLH